MAAHLVLLVPYPAQGHITPMLRLGRVLHARGFRPVLATPDFIHRRITADTDSTDSGVSYVSIPTGHRADSGTTPDFAGISSAMEEHMPSHFEILLRRLNWRCSGGGTPVQEPGLPIPGHGKLCIQGLLWLIGDSDTQKSRFIFWLKTLARSNTLQCLLINPFHNEAPDSANQIISGPKLLPISPLLNGTAEHSPSIEPSPSLWTEDNTCIPGWNPNDPNQLSMCYSVSWFESTHRPFIWVISDAWRNSLPPGFLNRVTATGHGKVVAWPPQEAVLKHKAVGCYITHRGWNSTMEAIRCKKRMLCYPVSGE